MYWQEYSENSSIGESVEDVLVKVRRTLASWPASRVLLTKSHLTLKKKKIFYYTSFKTNSKPLKRFRTDLNPFQKFFLFSGNVCKGFVESLRNLQKGLEFLSLFCTFSGFCTMYQTIFRFRIMYRTLKRFCGEC